MDTTDGVWLALETAAIEVFSQEHPDLEVEGNALPVNFPSNQKTSWVQTFIMPALPIKRGPDEKLLFYRVVVEVQVSSTLIRNFQLLIPGTEDVPHG
jgi:hypothetical protein